MIQTTRLSSLPFLIGLLAFTACGLGADHRFTFATDVTVDVAFVADSTPTDADIKTLQRVWGSLTQRIVADEETRQSIGRRFFKSQPLDVRYSSDVGGMQPPQRGVALWFADVPSSDDGKIVTDVVVSDDGRSARCRRTVAIGLAGEFSADDLSLQGVFDAAAVEFLTRNLADWRVVSQSR